MTVRADESRNISQQKALAVRCNSMKLSLTILLSGILVALSSQKVTAQDDLTSKKISYYWANVKIEHQNLLKTTRELCTISQLQSKLPIQVAELSNFTDSYIFILSQIDLIDSTSSAKIDSLNNLFFTLLIPIIDTIQKDKTLLGMNKINQKGKKLESEIKSAGNQIHTFNYWVKEVYGINIRFNDINL